MFIEVKVIDTPIKERHVKAPQVITKYIPRVVNTNHIVRIDKTVDTVDYGGKTFKKSKMKLSDGSSFEVMGEVSFENGEIVII